MPKLPTSLADVSTTTPVADDGSYSATIKDVTVGKAKSGLPMITVTYEAQVEVEGARRDMEFRDYFVMETKDHNPNEAGLRGFKRLIVAALDEERANADDFDTDELKGQQITVIVKQETYKDADSGEDTLTSRVKKILPFR